MSIDYSHMSSMEITKTLNLAKNKKTSLKNESEIHSKKNRSIDHGDVFRRQTMNNQFIHRLKSRKIPRRPIETASELAETPEEMMEACRELDEEIEEMNRDVMREESKNSGFFSKIGNSISRILGFQ